MTDFSTQPGSSYVDAYQPPAGSSTPTPPAMTPSEPTVSATPAPQTPSAQMPVAPPPVPKPMVDAAPPVTSMPSSTSQADEPMESVSQTLEDQNIFFLLGVEEANDEEKEAFLDELQQIIWEDFLENDVELLLTSEELTAFKQISDKTGIEEEERQTQMIEYLEKIIPDLEKIMLEKALELKEEMFRERLKELQDLFSDKPDKLEVVTKATAALNDSKWRDAAKVLNTLS